MTEPGKTGYHVPKEPTQPTEDRMRQATGLELSKWAHDANCFETKEAAQELAERIAKRKMSEATMSNDNAAKYLEQSIRSPDGSLGGRQVHREQNHQTSVVNLRPVAVCRGVADAYGRCYQIDWWVRGNFGDLRNSKLIHATPRVDRSAGCPWTTSGCCCRARRRLPSGLPPTATCKARLV